MRLTRPLIMALRPEIHQTHNGWLAVTEAGSPLRVGVMGNSEDDARTKFQAALGAWADLAEVDAEASSPCVPTPCTSAASPRSDGAL